MNASNNNTTIETTIATIKSLCDRSEACWADARENARGGRRLEIEGEEAECIDHWVDAIQSIQQHGYCGAAAAIESLKAASAIARNYGDNQKEEAGIQAIQAYVRSVFSGKVA